ncbi:MAG: hypothetical protein AAGF79_04635 [Pseudomonadota bacterium]
MKRHVALDYTLGEGWLAPWIDGLRNGIAVASSCSACDGAFFPPLRTCPTCRVRCDGWRRLSGGATVLYRTHGTDGDFAMARFDGATGAAIARSDALPAGATRAVLAASVDDPPQLSLVSEPQT